MKVSEAQIEELYLFTRKHFVEHYDVQTELVDHLANDIESQWEEAPDLNFIDALTVAFKKFGVFGFQDIIEAKSKALNKHYWIAVWTIYKQFFTLPKIIFTTALWCLTYLILRHTPYFNYTLIIVVSLLVLIYIIQVFRINKGVKRRQKETGRKWLYEDVIGRLGGMAGLAGVVIQFFPRILDIENSIAGYKLLMLTSALVALLILCYVTLFVVPKKITLHLKEEFKKYYV
ncbi:hypothetical protein ACJOV8_005435 [Formosa sp. 3Alg 14/1]|uniref:hypothetical protein n=1 Tax=Formosa sp. 3Alg 14/1 TaxID=3382190 RepID=UPI0039BE57A0